MQQMNPISQQLAFSIVEQTERNDWNKRLQIQFSQHN
jgi:hypothetical protein